MGLLADTSYTRTSIRLSEPSDDLLDSYSQPYSMISFLDLPSPDKKASPTRLLAEGILPSPFSLSRATHASRGSDNYFHLKGSDSEPLLAAFFQTFPSEVDSIGAVAVLALSLVAGDVIRLASSLPSSVIVPVEEEEEQIALD